MNEKDIVGILLDRFEKNVKRRTEQGGDRNPLVERVLPGVQPLCGTLHGLTTSLGYAAEEIAALLLKKRGYEVIQRPANVEISDEQNKEIDRIINVLAGGEALAPQDQISRITAASKESGRIETIPSDLYVRDLKLHLFLKSPKGSPRLVRELKRKVLQIRAGRDSAVAGIYYSTGDNGAKPSYLNRMFKAETNRSINDGKPFPELLIGRHFWNFVGGEKGYEQVLKGLEQAGRKLRNRYDIYAGLADSPAQIGQSIGTAGPNRSTSASRDQRFSGDDLRKADLKAASLKGALFEDVNAFQANLQRANLRKAVFTGKSGTTIFEEADFRDADLRQARLNGDFTGADFSRADLRGADLSGGYFERADFRGALLHGARFRKEEQTADFRNANLRGVDFRGVEPAGEPDMRYVNFAGSDLRKARFDGADLETAYLAETRLEGTTFHRCHLESASFSGSKGIRFEDRQPADAETRGRVRHLPDEH